MASNECAQCGATIEGKGIRYRDRTFCGDECLDEFEASFAGRDDLDPDEFDAGFDDDIDFVEDDVDGDEFKIDPDDF